MSLDLIKSFMVGIGFDIDEQSMGKANKSIDDAEKKIRDFNENSNKGFSETSSSLKDLFSLLSSSNTIGGLLPGLSKPLGNLIKDLKTVKKHYDSVLENKNKTEKSIDREVLKEKISKTVENVAEKTTTVKENIKDVIKENIKTINKEELNEFVENVAEKTTTVKENIKENIKDVVSENVTNIDKNNVEIKNKEIFNETVKNISKEVESIKEKFDVFVSKDTSISNKEESNEIVQNMTKELSVVKNAIENTFTKEIKFLNLETRKELFNSVNEKIVDIEEKTRNSLKESLITSNKEESNDFIATVYKELETINDSVKNILTENLNSTNVSTINSKVEDINEKIVNTKFQIRDFITESTSNINKEEFNRLINNVVEKTISIKSNVKNFVSENTSSINKENVSEFMRNTHEEVMSVKKTLKDFVSEKIENFSIKNTSVENITDKNVNTVKIDRLKETLKEKLTDLEIIKKKRVVDREDVPKLKDSVSYKEIAPKIDVKRLSEMKEQILMLDSVTKGAKTSATGFAESISRLTGKGGGMIRGFTASSIAGMIAIAGAILSAIAAIVALIAAIKKLSSYMDKLADKEISYEKLSRQLWTTKQTAEEVSKALDRLGISIEDLWLSPTLLKQFNQLRQDSNNLKIPNDFKENLELVQDLSFEFKRFKQLLSTLFEWIGHYILETLKGPLGEFKGDMQDLNSWLIEHIPEIAKVIGTAIGNFLKFLISIGKAYAFIVKISHPLVRFFKVFIDIGKKIDDMPDKTKRSARLIFLALMFAFSPLLLVIGLIDDVLTYFRGGESVIGDSIDFISDKFESFLDKASDKFGFLFKIMEKISGVHDAWKEYRESAEDNMGLVGFAISKLKGETSQDLAPDSSAWEEYSKKSGKSIDELKEMVNSAEVLKSGISFPDVNIESLKDKLSRVKDFSLVNNDEWSDYYTRGVEVLKSLKDKAKNFLEDAKLSINFDKNKLEGLKENAAKLKTFESNYVSSNNMNQSYMTSNTSNISKTNNTRNEVINNNNISVHSTDANQTGNVINKRLSGITTRNLSGAIE